ncbi:MAG: hypothetical protein JWP47_1679 [Polaromonas sp.]|nr:hypothetical protein [Polaromonas sp.]
MIRVSHTLTAEPGKVSAGSDRGMRQIGKTALLSHGTLSGLSDVWPASRRPGLGLCHYKPETALSNSEFSSAPHVQPHLPSLAGRAYKCKCGCPVFFRNSECLACGTPLGYDPEQARLLPLMPGQEPDTWVRWHEPASAEAQSGGTSSGDGAGSFRGLAASDEASILPPPAAAYTRCANLQTPAACNWLVPHDPSSGAPLLCRACRLNRTIPDLNDPDHPDNGMLWGRVELAKRRLVSALLSLGLPVASRVTEDTERGMMFDILRSPDNGPHVMTGHNTGLITLDLQEADDAVRESVRKAMREPYRTLLGHFRHEVGHYYWDRLLWGTPWLDAFRQLFGDERKDYAASLRQNYENGPPPQWQLHYVSAYASTHPWEDWAECWAHYLHMRDTVDTALSLGLATHTENLEFTPFTLDSLYQPDHPEAQHFLDFLNDWTRLTTLLNEMSRSMGQPDFYPFVLPHEVVAKLHFIHLLVTSTSWLPDDAGLVQQAQEAVDRQMEVAMHPGGADPAPDQQPPEPQPVGAQEEPERTPQSSADASAPCHVAETQAQSQAQSSEAYGNAASTSSVPQATPQMQMQMPAQAWEPQQAQDWESNSFPQQGTANGSASN